MKHQQSNYALEEGVFFALYMLWRSYKYQMKPYTRNSRILGIPQWNPPLGIALYEDIAVMTNVFRMWMGITHIVMDGPSKSTGGPWDKWVGWDELHKNTWCVMLGARKFKFCLKFKFIFPQNITSVSLLFEPCVCYN